MTRRPNGCHCGLTPCLCVTVRDERGKFVRLDPPSAYTTDYAADPLRREPVRPNEGEGSA